MPMAGMASIALFAGSPRSPTGECDTGDFEIAGSLAFETSRTMTVRRLP